MAASMAMCGQTDVGLRLLKSAIEGHYCAYAALQADPALVKLRQTPEFPQLLSAAKECQQTLHWAKLSSARRLSLLEQRDDT